MVAFSIQASKWVSEGDTENREKKGVKKLTLHRFSLSRLCATISASDRGSVRNGDRLSPGLQPGSTAQISRKLIQLFPMRPGKEGLEGDRGAGVHTQGRWRVRQVRPGAAVV